MVDATSSPVPSVSYQAVASEVTSSVLPSSAPVCSVGYGSLLRPLAPTKYDGRRDSAVVDALQAEKRFAV
ncbi:hypothetical protein MIR68_011141 [Amoeboaphelidium protococcarum]|nr:hypothetical protein MIR68_011141 [Amoeboaphelidium protococcarum]